MAEPRLIAITGPTASGKSALALELAERLGAELLSVDSMQVYRGFDVGTAKPSAAERARVVHHGVDLVEPTETFSAGAFAAYARDVLGRGRPVIAVGGTGLYLRAITDGLVAAPPAQAALRAALRAEEDLRPGAMHARLRAVDPESAARLHPHDRVRLERAIEVWEATGRPLSALHREPVGGVPTWTLALRWDRAALAARIDSRARAMLDAGWVDEVRGLLARGVPETCTPMKALGYPEIRAMLAGELPAEALLDRITGSTRRFAKRQLTWFNPRPSIEWIEPSAGLAARLEDRARSWLDGAGSP